MYRQGDVLLTPVAAKPIGAKLIRRKDQGFPGVRGIVLAAGEATGHHHRVVDPYSRLYRGWGGDRFLTVSKRGARLIHEEHDAIDLGEGVYAITRGREYVPPEPSRGGRSAPRFASSRFVDD